MTHHDLDWLAALADAATPGPWTPVMDAVYTAGPGFRIADITQGDEPSVALDDATFIAEARGAVPALIKRVKAAEAERDMWKRHCETEQESADRLAHERSAALNRADAAEARLAVLERQLLIATESGNAEAAEHEALRSELDGAE